MKPVFCSAVNPHNHLAIDNGRITGMVRIRFMQLPCSYQHLVKPLCGCLDNIRFYLYCFQSCILYTLRLFAEYSHLHLTNRLKSFNKTLQTNATMCKHIWYLNTLSKDGKFHIFLWLLMMLFLYSNFFLMHKIGICLVRYSMPTYWFHYLMVYPPTALLSINE